MGSYKSKFIWLLGFGFLFSSLLGRSLVFGQGNSLNLSVNKLPFVNVEEEIVKNFCERTRTETENIPKIVENIDSKYSVFVYLLCNNNGININHSNEEFRKYVKKAEKDDSPISFATLNFTPQCQKTYHECNLAQLSKEIMVQLSSELFMLKQADLIGFTQDTIRDTKQLKNKINQYAHEKFGIEEFCTNKNRAYKKTCSYMKGKMKRFEKAIKEFKILNTHQLYEAVKDKKGNEPLEVCISMVDPFLCGVLGETDQALSPFANIVYNELIRYAFFSVYYENILRKELENSTPDSQVKSDRIEVLKQNRNELFRTVQESIDDLNMISMTYPIHVGMLSHQENLQWIIGALAKTVSPFYSLYYKLRNVQKM